MLQTFLLQVENTQQLTLEASPIVNYLPIILLLVIAIAFPVIALTVSSFLRRTVFDTAKLTAYECGNDPIGDARERYSVRYYLIAMLFLIFDVETIFLFPWAIIYDKLAIFGLIEILIFLGILIVGYYYAWKKGALEWV
ncbi:MAG: NADH-quinone oxidoreductase subunit A [Blastocatellia bacterium]|nr:NADH-quinone oxidoreductase subunit A [Blastocatellia bacterium]MBL8194796.1 NADH-quinone oxidoreductase subunit A [Blastocatellia bacterium]MBN8724515.1 NADH-quinone oxidoreductase subunit A [Acidobacteriota bacterium]